MPVVDASGNRIARTLDGGPPQRTVYIPSPVPSPEPTLAEPRADAAAHGEETAAPGQPPQDRALSPPTSPTKAGRAVPGHYKK